MAWAAAAQLTAFKNAAGDDVPFLLARNNMLDAISSEWNETGQLAGTDKTDPEYPVEGAYSGRLDLGTRPAGITGQGFACFVVELPAGGVPMDSIAMKFLALDNATYTIRVQIANASTFDAGGGALTTGNFAAQMALADTVDDPLTPDASDDEEGGAGPDEVLTIARWSLTTSGVNPKRLLAWALGPPGGAAAISDYLDPEDANALTVTKVSWLRIVVSRDSGNLVVQPHLGEFWISARRQLARNFLSDGKYSERPDGASVEDFRAKSRARTRYVRAKGYRDIKGTYVMGETDIYGLPTNDVDTMHGVIDDSEEGTNPVWIVAQPKAQPQRAQMGYMPEDLVEDVRLPLEDFKERRFDFEVMEIPPFQKEEPA